MYCVIRVNAYPQLGNGHLMRCLTLAGLANKHGLKPLLVLSDVVGIPVNLIAAAKCAYTLLPAVDELGDAELFCTLLENLKAPCWVVVDVYALSKLWHQKVYPLCQQLLVIDDLANRNYFCDVLLDHTPGREVEDYLPLVNLSARLFTGSEHALLAPEFFAASTNAHSVRSRYFELKPPPKLLISLGGTDAKGLSLIWFDLLAPHAQEFSRISFLLASNAEVIPALKAKIELHNQTIDTIQLIIDANNMPQIVLDHDLALGGAGVSALERAALGMPTATLTLADNQIKQAQTLAEYGCAFNLGDWQQVPDSDQQQIALKKLLALKSDYAQCQVLSERAFDLISHQQPYSALEYFFTNQRVGINQ